MSLSRKRFTNNHTSQNSRLTLEAYIFNASRKQITIERHHHTVNPSVSTETIQNKQTFGIYINTILMIQSVQTMQLQTLQVNPFIIHSKGLKSSSSKAVDSGVVHIHFGKLLGRGIKEHVGICILSVRPLTGIVPISQWLPFEPLRSQVFGQDVLWEIHIKFKHLAQITFRIPRGIDQLLQSLIKQRVVESLIGHEIEFLILSVHRIQYGQSKRLGLGGNKPVRLHHICWV